MAQASAGYNHLREEKSPYLRQHAQQPVDWYPWGNAAFEKAKNEDKPILVSIGYSTCHWCHVMAEESFDDSEVAALMNQYLVNVKIDREERPDLDQIYISAVTAMTGSAGWPLNVFITPEGKPFYGGTYFPPIKRVSPAWKDIVIAIGNAWQDPEKRKQLITSAGRVTDLLRSHLGGGGETTREVNLTPHLLDEAVETISGMYDPENGGFSNAPKFPMPSILNFLMFYHRFAQHSGRITEKAKKAEEMAIRSLRKMADGGIYDHLGGGFHRYSTDAIWHVPHFEKMLYDNGQLIRTYLEAYSLTGNERFAEVARESIAYVLRDMTHPDGGFYSAEDADSVYLDLSRDPAEAAAGEHEKSEGGFYVWKLSEIQHLLSKDAAEIVAFYYRILKGGNVAQDPMGEFPGKNILHRARTISETAARFDRPEKDIEQVLAKARQDLLAARNERPRPHLDDKVLVEWNGLMISALAKAYRTLEDPAYLASAEGAIRFIYNNLYDAGSRRELYRRWRDGDRKVPAMATDYAFLVQALLDTYAANFDPWLLDWAIELADLMIDRFFDERQGGFFTTREAQDEHLLFRVKDVTDSVLPSAASVAALNCIRLYRYTGKDRYCKVTERTLQAAFPYIRKQPASVPKMLVALGTHLLRSIEVVLVGKKDAADVQPLLQAVQMFPPETLQLVRLSEDADRRTLAAHMPFIESMPSAESGAAAYVCYDRTCQSPVHNPDDLTRLLKEATEPALRKQ